jgi:hypothetical protein
VEGHRGPLVPLWLAETTRDEQRTGCCDMIRGGSKGLRGADQARQFRTGVSATHVSRIWAATAPPSVMGGRFRQSKGVNER